MNETAYDVVDRQTGAVVGAVYLDVLGRFVRFESTVMSPLEQFAPPSRVLSCADCGQRVRVPVHQVFDAEHPFYCLDCFKVHFERGEL